MPRHQTSLGIIVLVIFVSEILTIDLVQIPNEVLTKGREKYEVKNYSQSYTKTCSIKRNVSHFRQSSRTLDCRSTVNVGLTHSAT